MNAVWPAVGRTKSKHFVLKSWPEAEATQKEHGPLFPRQLPFHPHLGLSHFSPHPSENLPASPGSVSPIPSYFPFIYSLIHQTFTDNYCVLVTMPGPGNTGMPDMASLPGPSGERVGVSLCSSRLRYTPHKVISEASPQWKSNGLENLCFHLYYRTLFLKQQQEWQQPYLPRSLWLRLIFTCICIFFVHRNWERVGREFCQGMKTPLGQSSKCYCNCQFKIKKWLV